ncbi:unnamed protein product [Paramecium sonneborni]|uniref:Protein kinase domain-containing protein n=1 Tax=Paramecium sonneborni TaxID=65129 RepID=A0A8S1MQ63_9CILI|nr:unnamed protein product [Paramecium sonneborni]
MQNKYKKVQDIFIDMDKKCLLEQNKYETRLGLCEIDGHKKHAVIKILGNDNQPESLRLIEAIRNMSTKTQIFKGNPYIVECYSRQRTQTTFYFAFKKCKQNIMQATLDFYEILHMLASIIQLLKLFQQKGEFHGNLKPTNIFQQKKLNSTICFSTTDFFPFQYSNRIQDEFIDPELDKERPSIANDIYSLGKICNFVIKNRKCPYQNLINQMVCVKQERIKLDQLELQVEILIEKYEQKSLRMELNQKGITEEVIQKIIIQQVEEQKKKQQEQIKFQDFELNQIEDRDLNMRDRGYFFYLMSQEIRSVQTIDQFLLDCLILTCLSESFNSYQECKKLTQNKKLQQLVESDIMQMSKYLNIINLQCELYIQDLILKEYDVSFLKQYISIYSQPNQLFKKALSLVMEDIINKNLTKELQLNDELDKSDIKALNYILISNQMKQDKCYDYKGLQQYIQQQIQVIQL